jgi:phosphotransferase system  glucose/maltose/N-acetylglucosamine-specific IIC component
LQHAVSLFELVHALADGFSGVVAKIFHTLAIRAFSNTLEA